MLNKTINHNYYKQKLSKINSDITTHKHLLNQNPPNKTPLKINLNSHLLIPLIKLTNKIKIQRLLKTKH